ncbi:glycine-rich domain-containing protein [Burkholderia seminalis]|uniref:glycine-rich domain-containing protein n=1 Tax=Burkholderia seminalis TaxID=488731 RepID=UPI0012E393E1|nr:hypothetical protein [Burkholderia seminalis]
MLREWKVQQLTDFDALGRQGWALTERMAEEALAAPITFANSTVNLGGEGGRAPGAGGGGGGAIGPNARGGAGGPGGNIRYEGDEAYRSLFAQTPIDSLPYGAGGGGAGAIGENAVGGDGGGGGELVNAFISAEEMAELRARGFERIEVTLGKGGEGAQFPGQHGSKGEDSVINFLSSDGHILRSIRAMGGKAGRAGIALPPNSREVTVEDIERGFAVSTLLTSEVLHHRDGVANLLSAGWGHYVLDAVPSHLGWMIFCVISMGNVDRTKPIVLFATVSDPEGVEQFRGVLPNSIGDTSVSATVLHGIPIQLTATKTGIYMLRVLSGRFELARLPIDVRLKAP